MTATSKDEDTVKASAQVELGGNQVETLSVEKVENTTVIGNVASSEVTHFPKYIVLNRTV